MNTIFKSSKLDEMQEIQMLKVEHYGLWIAFWGLGISTVVQSAMGAPLKQYAGEGVLLCLIGAFELIANMKAGLWDRSGKPSLKNNLLAAAAAGVFTCVMVFVSNRYLPGALFSGVFNSILTFSVLQIWAVIYCGRRKHLDSMAEEEEDSHE